MARFDHPHVMTLLGVAISQVHQTLYIVMPYMAQGSLLSYLRRHRADLTVGNEEMRDLVKESMSMSCLLFAILVTLFVDYGNWFKAFISLPANFKRDEVLSQ